MAGDGASWHFFFAWVFVVNGLGYVALFALAAGIWRATCAPTRSDIARRSAHRSSTTCAFAIRRGEAAKRYNVLQKLAYLVVIFVLLPLIILMGFGDVAAARSLFAGWVDLFGGRQSARTLHFIVAWLLVAFVADPRVRGDRHRTVEQPALDDHRPLSRAAGGRQESERPMTEHAIPPVARAPALPRARVAAAPARCCSPAATGCRSTEWFPKVLELAENAQRGGAQRS